MKRFISINGFECNRWPAADQLEQSFLDPARRNWAFWDGGGGGYISVSGLDGTENEPDGPNRSNARIAIRAHRKHGATLDHHWWDGKRRVSTSHLSLGSTSDMTKLPHLDNRQPFAVGLFIPFELAWLALKDFMVDPIHPSKSVPWINAKDLPPSAIPPFP